MKNNNINNKYINDFYKNKARILNLKSRSWFKIKEINDKFNLINNNYKNVINIIDLGSYPGGWLKYLININKKINIFSCDIKNINFKNKRIFFLNCNLLYKNEYNIFIKFVKVDKVNFILSDMMSNISGYNIIDNKKSINLIKIIINICNIKLIKGGSCIFKTFNYILNLDILIINKIKMMFKYIHIYKPKSSRKQSNEIYIIAKYFI